MSDPTTIRALAHPVRLDLLEALGRTGPATAAQCGRTIGVSQASCSFHLRQLAKYGFVQEAAPGPDRRERRWQLTDRRFELGDDGEIDRAAARELGRAVVERETARLLDWIDRAPQEPREWREAVRGRTTTVQVTAAEAAELQQAWDRLLAPYLDREPAQEHRTVHYFMAAVPLPLPRPLPDTEAGDESNERQH